MISLQNALNSLSVPELKSRLSLIKGAPKLTRKPEIIALLSNELSNNLEKYLHHLNDLEQAVIAETIYIYRNGEFNLNSFRAKYGALPAYFLSRSYSDQQTMLALFFWKNLFIVELTDRCKKLIDCPNSYQLIKWSTEDIKRHIKKWQKERDDDYKESQSELTILSMEIPAFHDLQAVLNLVDSGKITVSEKTKIAGSATTKKITSILLEGDFYSAQDDWDLENYAGGSITPIRAYAWPLLIQSTGLGFVRRVGTKLQLTAKGKKVSQSPVEESLRLIYQHWRDKGLLDEFNRINVIKGQTGRGQRLSPLIQRRLIIEEALKVCPKNEWIAVDDFFRLMQAENFDLRVIYDFWKLYIADSRYGCLEYSACSFETIQGRYILVYLFEYLATLGMIDVAYLPPYFVRNDFKKLQEVQDLYFFSRYDGLLFFRINPLGSYCLLHSEHYQLPKQTCSSLLRTDDSLIITLQRSATPTEKLILERYLHPKTDKTYQLDQSVFLQAIEQGGDFKIFSQFLNEASGLSLSKSIMDELAVLDERCKALSDIGTARLINCSSVALAKMLATDPNTGKFCFHAHDKLLVIPDKSEKAFQKATKKLGYILPKKTL